MPNATALKFGYPASRVAETASWLVLVRPKQPTWGSLVLVCKEPVQAFSEVSADAFADLQSVVKGVEGVLSQLVGYERINYLMLMMLDFDVHFHVVPRYDGVRTDGGSTFPDAGWPGPPDLTRGVDLDEAGVARLTERLRAAWADLAG